MNILLVKCYVFLPGTNRATGGQENMPSTPTAHPPHQPIQLLNILSFIIIIFISIYHQLPSPFQFQNDASYTIDNRPSLFVRYRGLT